MPKRPYVFTSAQLRYLELLARSYPTIQSVCTQIIDLQAVQNLPKATEHFMSDLHGEYEAFYHILNNCSGVIREKVQLLFGDTLSKEQCSELCTLIYYPREKLKRVKREQPEMDGWYRQTFAQLIALCKLLSSKYTRQKVRQALPPEYSYIIDELLHAQPDEDDNQLYYHQKIVDTIISIDNAEPFVCAMAALIKQLAVDCLHIVGDIYDRGPRADSIMDMLMEHHNVDIEWGNHDILWMGAACGSEACIATAVRNSLAYGNLSTLENGYGISLRPLTLFAARTYQNTPSAERAAHRAITVMLLKLEGQVILRNPDFAMSDRLLLDKIDAQRQTVALSGRRYTLKDPDFPTVDPADPYALSPEEAQVLAELKAAFKESRQLHRHVQFLYARGAMYRCYNHNLLYHGCVLLDESGQLLTVQMGGRSLRGKAYMDYADSMARKAYFGHLHGSKKVFARDFMWYLWCGRYSPLFGREKMTTFERMYIADENTWEERKNPYYTFYNSEKTCKMILQEFGLRGSHSHIINGHVPVRAQRGESPIKGGGRLIVIDGGFCRAYQPTTGIAGYTLIYNSHGMRIMSHQPFADTERAIDENEDILSRSQVFETEVARLMVQDTDKGSRVSDQLYDLSLLLTAYRQGDLIPKLPASQAGRMPGGYEEDEPNTSAPGPVS